MIKYLLIFLLLINGITVYAQDSSAIVELMEEDIPVTDEYTDTNITFRNVPVIKDSITVWKNKKEYAWNRDIESRLRQQQDNIEEPQYSLMQKVLGSPFLRVMFWLIAACFLLFIILKLFGTNGVFARRPVEQDPEVKETKEPDYNEADYENLIRQSYLLGDFRTAVRYQFLKTLKILDSREIIDMAPDKTNYQYLGELPAELKNDFSRLVMVYEYSWYGKSVVEKGQYDRVESDFHLFQNKAR